MTVSPNETFATPTTKIRGTNVYMNSKRHPLIQSMNADIAIIGLGVMGANLAKNILRNGFSISAYDLNEVAVTNFKKEIASEDALATNKFSEAIEGLAKPRKVLLAVQAGPTIDTILEQLFPLLEPNDIIIDCGNSYFLDTERRQITCAKLDLHFLGVGMSGGKEGALKGPSLMPGGNATAWNHVKTIFEAVAAKEGDRTYVRLLGPGGSGHFIKTIHNGIEYGMMQAIAEAYELMRRAGFTAEDISEVFSVWQQGQLSSFLIEATAICLKNRDAETGKALIDLIEDVAQQKGTGKWTIIEALNLGVPCHCLAAAVQARNLSADIDSRSAMAEFRSKSRLSTLSEFSNELLIKSLEEALYFTFLSCYSQGFSIIDAASKEFAWKLKLQDIAFLWQSGCIIRSKLLKEIELSFESDLDQALLLSRARFGAILRKCAIATRQLVRFSTTNEVAVPVFASALTYFDSLKSEKLPQNLIQAQRDFFGAHKFARTDREGLVSIDWLTATKSSDS